MYILVLYHSPNLELLLPQNIFWMREKSIGDSNLKKEIHLEVCTLKTIVIVLFDMYLQRSFVDIHSVVIRLRILPKPLRINSMSYKKVLCRKHKTIKAVCLKKGLEVYDWREIWELIIIMAYAKKYITL